MIMYTFNNLTTITVSKQWKTKKYIKGENHTTVKLYYNLFVGY